MPASINRFLRSYQRDGIRFLFRRGREPPVAHPGMHAGLCTQGWLALVGSGIGLVRSHLARPSH